MFTIYKTTCHVNNKIYIGLHKCTKRCSKGQSKPCEYYGSGTVLNKALKKYGKENFSKEILFQFPTKEEALIKEKELVTEEFVLRNDTYNQTIGGNMPPNQKGFKHSKEQIQKRKDNFPEERKKKFGEIARETIKSRKEKTGKYWSDETIQKRNKSRMSKSNYTKPMMKEANTEEAIRKRVKTRMQNGGYSTDLSYLKSEEIVFKRTKQRISNQLKNGKNFSNEILIKYDLLDIDR